MTGKKAATIVEAARALVEKSGDSVRPEDAAAFLGVTSSAYLTTPELQYLHRKLAEYSGKLAVLGFIYSELVIPSPGPVPGAVQLELPGSYKVTALPDLVAGLVDAGRGRKFLALSWGGTAPGTIVFRRNESPDCWVEVGNYLGRKDPEGAVTCHLFSGTGDRATPIDAIKERLALSERRYWRERSATVKSTLRNGKKSAERGSDAGRDS